ncbi:uncharacterized protein ACR2FA_003948 isoform 1-T1 [Aphomia sociella]
MAYHFDSGQFNKESMPKRLGNWQVPRWAPSRARPVEMRPDPKPICDLNGRFLPGAPRGTSRCFGHFTGTWELPRKITRKVAEDLAKEPPAGRFPDWVNLRVQRPKAVAAARVRAGKRGKGKKEEGQPQEEQTFMMCRHVYTFNNVDVKTNTFNSSDNYEFLGESDKTYFSNDGRSITYDNDPSNNTILLICSQGDTRLHIYSLDDPHELILSFYSKDACLKQIEEAGRSLGSTLLVVFFSILIFYLVLGICTKKFLMGATGIEVIPNLVFWMDLPNLVRDGWAFAISGFKLPPRVGPTSSPDPNSYDSI